MKGMLLFLYLMIGYAHAEAEVGFDIALREGVLGVNYVGEITNNGEKPINNVKVTIIAYDENEKMVDVSEGYVYGYSHPEYPLRNTFVPAGSTVPFSFYGDTEIENIYEPSLDITVNYEEVQPVMELPSDVVVNGSINEVESIIGTDFFGEIHNGSTKCIYFTKIIFAFKDNGEKMLDVGSAYIMGEDYMLDDLIHTNTMIQPQSSRPFKLFQFLESDEIGSYYTIVNYEISNDTSYSYHGHENINVVGSINQTEQLGDCVYLGEIENETDRHIYFTEINFVCRNENEDIIDISSDYVSGTSYTLSSGIITDTHIAPSEKAPFEVITDVSPIDISSYEYYISYQYSDPLQVENEAGPEKYIVKQNFPNPFNASTTIEFMLTEITPVKLTIFNSVGQITTTLIDKTLPAGNHAVVWNSGNNPSGVYIYRLQAHGRVETRRMTLLK